MTSKFGLVFRIREFRRDDHQTQHITVGGKQVLLLHEMKLNSEVLFVVGELQSNPTEC